MRCLRNLPNESDKEDRAHKDLYYTAVIKNADCCYIIKINLIKITESKL